MIAALLGAAVVAQTVRMAVPYVCAGLGGVWSERSGVVNIALEGILLAGGLAGVVGHLATGSAAAGVLTGATMGAALGAVHALLVVRGGVDAIVSGLAINLAPPEARASCSAPSTSRARTRRRSPAFPSARRVDRATRRCSCARASTRTTLLAAVLVAWSGVDAGADALRPARARVRRETRRPRRPRGST